MPIDYPFSEVSPVVPSKITAAAISLTDWIMVKVTGLDAKHYLQGQLTYNLNELAEGQVVYCTHSDPKGRVLANLVLFYWKESYYYLVRRDISERHLAELKKYAIFSKVLIEPLSEPHYLIGFVGNDLTQHLVSQFATLPDAEQNVIALNEQDLLLYLAVGNRYLLITTTLPELCWKLPRFSNTQWLLSDLIAGWAVITPDSTAQLLPQAINIDALNGISFNKGCYVGQEMITRATFRGANKRAMFLLAGESNALPEVGQQILIELNQNNWKQTGLVLQAIRTSDNSTWIQVILNKDISLASHFRVNTQDSNYLKLQSLPYAITE